MTSSTWDSAHHEAIPLSCSAKHFPCGAKHCPRSARHCCQRTVPRVPALSPECRILSYSPTFGAPHWKHTFFGIAHSRHTHTRYPKTCLTTQWHCAFQKIPLLGIQRHFIRHIRGQKRHCVLRPHPAFKNTKHPPCDLACFFVGKQNAINSNHLTLV